MRYCLYGLDLVNMECRICTYTSAQPYIGCDTFGDFGESFGRVPYYRYLYIVDINLAKQSMDSIIKNKSK